MLYCRKCRVVRDLNERMFPMIKVERCKGGFGITDGKKWFAYIYPTEDAAKAAMVKAGGFEDRMVRYVNISYPEAFMPARGV